MNYFICLLHDFKNYETYINYTYINWTNIFIYCLMLTSKLGNVLLIFYHNILYDSLNSKKIIIILYTV